MNIDNAIAELSRAPGAILGLTARPEHHAYKKVRDAGLLSRCTCGQKKLGWLYPEFIIRIGKRVWTVGRDAKSNKISCGAKTGYHSSHPNDPSCSQ